MPKYKQHPAFSSNGSATLIFSMRRKRLHKLLGMAEDVGLLEAAWVLEWGRYSGFPLPQGYDFPAKYLQAKLPDQGRIHSWEVETLLVEAFGTPKRIGKRAANTKAWNFFIEAVSALRSAENAEGGKIDGSNILREIERVLYRQMPWQARHENLADMVRWQSIFGNNQLRALFEDRMGIAPKKMMWLAVAFAELFKKSPYVTAADPSSKLNLTKSDIDAFLTANSISLPKMRQRAQEIVRSSGLAYRQSPFRPKPMIRIEGRNGTRYLCPLRQPLFWRATEGLYYDIVDDPRAWNLVGTEFELYQRRLLAAAFNEAEISGDFSYGTKKEPRKAPDILVSRAKGLDLVFECKAKRLPVTEKVSAQDQRTSLAVGELAKGVFQLVRFRLDVRNGLLEGVREHDQSQYVVLTLDDWVFTGPTTKDDIFARASDLLSRKNIEPNFDIREITFCTAAELDNMICRLTLNELVQLFSKNREKAFREYTPSSLIKDFADSSAKWNSYPLARELDFTDLLAS